MAERNTEMKDCGFRPTGDAATELGISRDALVAALRAGAPDATTRVAGRRMSGQDDFADLHRWFEARGPPGSESSIDDFRG